MSELPPSREVRLQAGVTEGSLEDMLFRAHTGPSSELIPLIAGAELFVQNERSKAAETIGQLLSIKLSQEGYLTVACIRDALRDWHEAESMGEVILFGEEAA